MFSKHKKGVKTAYFIVRMNGSDISIQFYSDKKCTKSIYGLDIISKFGDLTSLIHLWSIYHGAHGTSEYNSSFQINVAKVIFQQRASNIPDIILDTSEEEQEPEEKIYI